VNPQHCITLRYFEPAVNPHHEGDTIVIGQAIYRVYNISTTAAHLGYIGPAPKELPFLSKLVHRILD
jgi:hypothetical protein